MKTIVFDYAKKDGSVSTRTLLAQVQPSKGFYAGIDMSALEPNDAAEFAARANILHDEFLAKLKELQAEFDLTHNYRRFLTSGMSSVVEV